MPMVDELIEPLYWVRDDEGMGPGAWYQFLGYNAWPGVEWYSLRSGDVVPTPDQRISASTSIHAAHDGRYTVRTVRVNTTGPNFRRTVRDLTWTQACEQASAWRDMHERYVLGRLGTRRITRARYGFTPHADEMPTEEVTPRCDYCHMAEEDTPGLTWNGDEGMHQECIGEMNNTVARALGEVPMPEPGRPRLNALVPGAHEGWFV